MELGSVVIAAGAQGKKIEGSSRGCVAKDLDFDVSQAGMECDGHCSGYFALIAMFRSGFSLYYLSRSVAGAGVEW